MATLAEIRAKYPQYKDVDDTKLADGLYRKFYEGKIERSAFDERVGLKPRTFEPLPTGPDERGTVPLTNAMAGDTQAIAEITAAENAKPKYGDDIVSATGKAIGNVPGRLLEGLAGLEQMAGDALGDVVARNENNPETDPGIARALGMAAAERSVAGQLRGMQAEGMQKPIDVGPGSVEYYVSSIIGSTAEMAPGLAASLLLRNPMPAMVAIGAQSGGTSYAKAKDLGLTAEQARTYAGAYALAEAIPEAIPLGMILKEGGKLLPRVLKGAVGEGATEMLTEGIQILLDKGMLSEDVTWGEAWSRIKDAGIVGAGAGGLMGGAAAGTEAATNATAAAIKPALDVSSKVLGNGVQIAGQLGQTINRRIKESQLAAEMAQELAGKPLQERVKILAERKRQMLEPATAEAPVVETPPLVDEKGAAVDGKAVIRSFEGYRDTPYWDVNAYRNGFGSDTMTDADGTVRKVRPGDRTDEAGAERDLARRLETEFTPSIVAEVGAEAWGDLPNYAQAALQSVTYNYGNLPNSVAAAVRTGDIEAIANAVEDLKTHNGGVNADRREKEADLIRGKDVDLAAPRKSSGGGTGREFKVDETTRETSAEPTVGEVYEDDSGARLRFRSMQKGNAVLERDDGGLVVIKADEWPSWRKGESDPDDVRLFQIDRELEELGDDPSVGSKVEKLLQEQGEIVARKTAPKLGGKIVVPRQKAAEPVPQPNLSPEKAPVESLTPSGKRVNLQPTVVELADLKKATGDLQPRDRSRASSDQQIEDIAINLDFARLSNFATTDRGAPMVNQGGTVISGNGRTAAIRRAAEAYPAKYAAYVEALKAAGYKVDGFKQPVLVGRIADQLDRDAEIELARDSNQMATAGLSAAEQAKGDAKLVDRDLVEVLRETKDRNARVKAFIAKLPQTERGKLLDRDGQVSTDGIRRMQNALLTAAYDDPQTTARATEDPDDAAKSITGALVDVAPAWLVMREDVKEAGQPTYDLTDSLMTAINLLARAREKAGQQGRPVKALINEAIGQIDMLSGDVDPVAIEFVKAFYSDGFGRAKSRDDIAAFLTAITAEVESALKPSMFGDSPKPEEVIGGAKRKTERAADTQGGLFASRSGGGRTEKGGKPAGQSRDEAASADDPVEDLEQLVESTLDLKFNPGAGYVPMLQAQALPARQQSVTVADGKLDMPAKPTKRDEPRKKILDVIGDRLYQQKVKGKTRLGFYRQQNSEVRIKHYDDVEVMAHEAAHYLDFDASQKGRFTALRKRFTGEINPLSYTQEPQLINLEGFAEYVRLWSTQYATAKRYAPTFTAAFEAELKKAGVYKKMLAFQKAAHRWYYQGDMHRFRGKSGESKHFVDELKAFARSRPAERFLQGFLDPVYGAKVMERETTGTIASAERSMWKLWRMTRGADSMHEAAIMDGPLVLEADGSYSTTGKGLLDIFYPATKKGAERFDLLMEYFKARRAEELTAQKRERLFTKSEIAAGLDLAKTYPEFATIFDEWLAFNDTMLQFYADMGLITQDQRQAIAERNKNYVPFVRVLNPRGDDNNPRGDNQSTVTKKLQGGEQATREIATNILDGLHSGIQAALTARAKATTFSGLQRSQAGSEFAVEIGPDSKRIKVAEAQLVERIKQVLLASGRDVIDQNGMVIGFNNDPEPIDISDVESVILMHPELAAFWQHNQTPVTTETAIESVIIGDKLRHFEINSPLLVGLLSAPRPAPPLIKALRIPKRVLTNLITSLPQFQVPNLVRDTMSAAVQSQSGARIGYETLRGLKATLADDPRFKSFRANGGLFGGRVSSTQEGGLDPKTRKLPAQNSWDMAGKVLAGWQGVVSAIETGSRVGEHARALDKGENPLEAAFRGRMISGDFAQMGRNEVWSWLLQITPFANAGLRGIETMVENLLTVDGKVRLKPKNVLKFTAMALTRAGITLTIATALLWLLNQDDERYKRLTVDEKTRFWHFWTPDGQHWQIPKPYGVGFIFADLPEIALDFIKNRDGEAAAKQMAFSLAQHFLFLDYPAVLNPFIEAATNRKFTGAPIIPSSLAGLEGEDVQYQRTDQTPELYRRLGETLKISPLMAQHYAKGFLGYLEAYMVDSTEFFLWDKEAWGERPFERNVLQYFTQQFDGSETPFRTKWTEGYYDLRSRAQSKALAFRTLFKEAQRSTDPITKFSEKEVNLVLRELSKKFARVDKGFADGPAYLEGIKYNPKLTRKEKEAKINAYYETRNDQLGEVYRQIDALVTKLEQGNK